MRTGWAPGIAKTPIKGQWLLILLSIFCFPTPLAFGDAASKASNIFLKINGYRLPAGQVRTDMEKAINEGDLIKAAHYATEDDAFYNSTLVEWATPLAARDSSTRWPLSDFVAMVVGATRDNMDARALLTEDFTYVGNSNDATYTCKNSVDCQINFINPDAHYKALYDANVNLRKYLVKQSPQWPQVQNADSAGLLTSRGWGAAFLSAGTNRRAIAYAMENFLCKPISELMNPTMPDLYYNRIRRDVDRAPGGDPLKFQSNCRGCHGPMDAMAGAYAYFDWLAPANDSSPPMQTLKIQDKMNRNSQTFPNGYVTVDNSWINYFTEGKNADIGWRGERMGYGVRSLGALLANSMAFSQCMAKRVFRQVCSRDPYSSEADAITKLANDFESNSYNLRYLFEAAVVLPACTGQ